MVPWHLDAQSLVMLLIPMEQKQISLVKDALIVIADEGCPQNAMHGTVPFHPTF